MIRSSLLKIIIIILYIFTFLGNKYFILCVISICIHESFHVLYLKLNNIKKIDLKVSLLGFKIDLHDNLSINKMFLLYSIGSLSNIFIFFLCLFLNFMVNSSLLNAFMIVNLIIGIINLIPAFPLDGIMVLRNILFRRFEYTKVQGISIIVSFLMGILILLFGIVYFGFSLSYIIMAMFIFINTFREYKIFKSINVKGLCTIISFNRGYTLEDIISLYKIYNKRIFFIVDGEFNIIDKVYITDIINLYNRYGNVYIKDLYK